MKEIIMPKMGDAMEEGTLLQWLKKEGDAVKSGEAIATIQTDKATLELEAEASGTLSKILIKPGETVPVGKPIAMIAEAGEKPAAKDAPRAVAAAEIAPPVKKAESPKPQPPTKKAEPPKAPARPSAPAPNGQDRADEFVAFGGSMAGGLSSTPAGASSSTPSVDRVKASPLARKVAQELGVELVGVRGSGPGGRIVEDDVRAVASVGTTKQTAAPAVTRETPPPVQPSRQPATVGTGTSTSVPHTDVPLNKIRQITAKVTSQSKREVPHFYVTVEVDADKIIALKEQFEQEGGDKVSINDFVIRACVLALIEMPVVNSSYDGDKLLQYTAINVGMAVALDDGLTLPVIHGAQNMTIRQIGAAARDLAHKARENRLHPDELFGSTFSISNMGMLHVDNFAAIIFPPNAAIVAVSTARKTVVPNDEDDLEIRMRMNLTGSFDHRVVDGALGAKFMNIVRDYLQNPTRMLG
jgi:pyruvate dehydrogenase E2 component (dihydrolipoamide acetyltransferase)